MREWGFADKYGTNNSSFVDYKSKLDLPGRDL